ncbi:MAG TPA: TIGR03067 domain-containing protein [Gemmataceae bacterium]|jgi:uncharacterized protein (TIGR03067 family)
MSSALAIILTAGVLTGADVPAPDGKVAQEQVIPPGSRWVDTEGEVWEFGKGGQLQTTGADGKKDAPSRYVLNTTTNPPQIDIITIDGTGLGIYRLKGDRLEICWACPGTERPTKFVPNTDEDGAPVTETLTRAK